MHTGIDTALFHPHSGAKAADPTIVFVGKMVRNKGVEVLVEAVCRIAADIPDVKLRLLGGGEPAVIESLKRRAAEWSVERALDMPGYVDRRDLPEQLSRAHVFAAPSKYEGGPGFVYLEAMACGLPVIGCRGSGVAEVIHQGENGLLVPPDDVDALAGALLRLLSDSREREAMGERAKSFVSKYADSGQCVARIADFYEAVVRRTVVSSERQAQ
jgi:glycosyltransferase involved in cell wall biosynthesis